MTGPKAQMCCELTFLSPKPEIRTQITFFFDVFLKITTIDHTLALSWTLPWPYEQIKDIQYIFQGNFQSHFYHIKQLLVYKKQHKVFYFPLQPCML